MQYTKNTLEFSTIDGYVKFLICKIPAFYTGYYSIIIFKVTNSRKNYCLVKNINKVYLINETSRLNSNCLKNNSKLTIKDLLY